MELKDIRQLIRLVDEKKFAEFELEQGEFRLRIKRNDPPIVQYASSLPSHTQGMPMPNSPEPLLAGPVMREPVPETEEEVEAGLHVVASPIVGTFYRAPSATADPFVREGSRVEPGTILCIVEAMKIMNEIPSDAAGVLEKIHVKNGQPVEYGQPLFSIRTEG